VAGVTTLTERNRASGRPRGHFVVLGLSIDGGREVWLTPEQARQWVAAQPDESGLNAGVLAYADEVDRARRGAP
jgi:hypothetical protein